MAGVCVLACFCVHILILLVQKISKSILRGVQLVRFARLERREGGANLDVWNDGVRGAPLEICNYCACVRRVHFEICMMCGCVRRFFVSHRIVRV